MNTAFWYASRATGIVALPLLTAVLVLGILVNRQGRLPGLPAEPVWRTVSVAAGSCADANAASTASVIRGRRALGWLTRLGLPSRLVDATGAVFTLAGWPDHSEVAQN